MTHRHVETYAECVERQLSRTVQLRIERKIIVPLYMDVHHKVDGLTKEAVEGAHQCDLAVQETHGVSYLKYWFDEDSGRVYCLVDAPSKEAATAVHQEAHGLVADEITEVREGA